MVLNCFVTTRRYYHISTKQALRSVGKIKYRERVSGQNRVANKTKRVGKYLVV